MAKGSGIIVSADPQGKFKEGIIVGTPLPGTLMEIVPATEPVGGRLSYRVYQPGTDGDRRPVLVLLEDELQGKTVDDAFVTGKRGKLYAPIPGEELNVRVAAAGTGTDDAVAIGDLLIADSGTGLLVATTGTPESEPFQALETVADVTADGDLVHCMFTGY